MKTALTIASSDSSGGAGIQADLKTFGALGVYGMSAIASLTAQNTCGVISVYSPPESFLKDQLESVFDDIRPDAVKIGMVPTSDMIEIIAELLEDRNAKNIVLDPVMVATSGAVLVDEKGANASVEKLFPLADVITPNMGEAGFLTGLEVIDEDTMITAAEKLDKMTDGYVLVKGGHLDDSANDLLYKDGEYIWIEGPRVDNKNVHGTGCTLSSAIASYLAKGEEMEMAIKKAKKYITSAIEDGMDLGKCDGPLNHFHEFYPTK